jgi:hypothetical protein
MSGATQAGLGSRLPVDVIGALVLFLAAFLPLAAAAGPIRVVNLTGGSPGLPVKEALAGLGARAELANAGDLARLPAGSVLLLDGATDLRPLQGRGRCLEEFVERGGGVLVAGLADSLPHTAALWRALGAAAPADVPAADLFPDDSGDWQWIGVQAGETPDHLRYIRKGFEIAKPVRRALVRCTVDNLYWIYLNGKEIGTHWSWYDYELWDITAALRPGRNVLSFKARNVDGPGGFFAQLGIEYQDGSRELIVSDTTWKFHIPEEPAWSTLDFDDSAWGPATDVVPMVQYTHIVDRGIEAEGAVVLQPPHPILNGITERFGTHHTLRGVVPRIGAVVLARVGERPVVLCGEYGQGRVVLIDAVQAPGGIGSSDLSDDLLADAILWLGRRPEGLAVASVAYPPSSLAHGADVRLSYALEGVAAVSGSLTATLTHGGKASRIGQYALHAGQAVKLAWTGEPLREASADGSWQLDLTAQDGAGDVSFHRSLVSQVVNPLSIPTNRTVVARGMTVQFRGELQEVATTGRRIAAAVVDPWGREFPVPEPEVKQGVWVWTYPVPDFAEGEYRLVVTVTAGGKTVDSFGLPFHVVPRLDLADVFPTTMRLSELRGLDPPAIEREIDDIRAHGFNTLTFNAHRLGAKPGSPYDHAEDYAQRQGMAISYSFQGDFCLLQREGVPSVSVFSPEYRDAIRPRIQAAVETCRQVPRLLNVQGYMDEPFQVSGNTFDDRPPAKVEFKRRYGIDLPTREQARQDPALWLKYVDFWSDGFAAGWRQSYAMVKELCPDVWVELTHDSHCTFGAAGRGYTSFWAVDDVFHWGAPFDAVNYDIYPYISTDFRTGAFGQNRLPRLAGMHMAFAQMRNLATTHDKKLGFWLESGWDKNLAPDAPGRQFVWSPRELTYTAIAAGCDYLNTFWGIPEDPRWWETYRSTMNEVKSIAPLLTRSRVPRAPAAFLFPRTQHVLLQEEYWNVMVALEAYRQAAGGLDCIHEEQLAKGTLKEYKILVLFDIRLMKRHDAEIVRDWVQAGGRLIADEVPSLDENRQPLGVFEPLFGVKGSAAVQIGAISVSGRREELWGRRSYERNGATVIGGPADGAWAPLLSQRAGKGEAFLFNFPVKECYLDALTRAKADGAADAVLMLLFTVARAADGLGNATSTNPNIEAAVRQTPDGTALLLLINHESRDETTVVSVPNLPPGGIVRDLVSGARLGAGERYAMKLQCPWGETRLLGFFPADPKGLALTVLPRRAAPGETVEYRLTVGGRGVRGNYVLDVTVSGPDGRAYQAFSALTCTAGATCRRSLRLPLNAEPGTWTIRARSLWDGAQVEGTFVVK